MATFAVNRVTMVKKKRGLPAKMAARNVEVRPVGAWVQPEPRNIHHPLEAVIAAEEEERRAKQDQDLKQQQLQQFQHDVKRRVAEVERLKKFQQLQKSYRAVELERQVLQQTVKAAESSTSWKDRCNLIEESNLAIRQPHSVRIHDPKNAISKFQEEQTPLKMFQEQSNQIQKYHKQARRNLVSKRIMSAAFVPHDLPGGAWKSGSTRDPLHTSLEDIVVIDDSPEPSEPDAPEMQETTPKQVVFDLDPQEEETRDERISRKSASSLLGHQVERAPVAPAVQFGLVTDVNPGVVDEEEKRRAVNQRAMYRRLFMDIERAQVKENLRRKEHRKTISRLKQEKELERQRQEEISHQQVAPRDPVTGETECEMILREMETEESLRSALELEESRRQKNKENHSKNEVVVKKVRFLEALKANVQEKIEKRGLDLPPLCCCGVTIWDTNPETCANNCIFYKNPKAYAKALQSLLTSCEVL